MFSKVLGLYLILVSSATFASWDGAKRSYEQKRSRSKMENMVVELVNGGFSYSALPMMKEYLISETRNLSSKMDLILSRMIGEVGVKQFETLPYRYLIRSKSNNIRYIIAKKYMREQKYNKSLTYLNKISSDHSVYPFAKNMQATIEAIGGKSSKAQATFKECVVASNNKLSDSPSNRRLKLNRDYCTVGIARSQFAARKFSDADLLYLDIPKSSMIWPEILFEEAWNSYYQKNYNRTLGKLVSYKAPVFEHIFNPEIEVLSALTYLKLCLFQDAKKISNDFYKKNLRDTRRLRLYLKKNKRNYTKYYDLMVKYQQNGKGSPSLVRSLLSSIEREESFVDSRNQLSTAAKEYDSVRAQSSSKFKRFIIQNIQEALRSHKKIMGASIRGKMVSHYAQLYKAFEGMSYIKLEVLAQRKAKLYSFEEGTRARGDIKYIQRNEKQYFWDFNGEFWADELGDYVFALKSEC